jgi:hypothetical protein
VPQDALFRKGSLFIVTGPNEHLHVIMNDPVDYSKKGGPTVLLVNFCTFDGNGTHDSTCLLNVGDHPFISHPTYVAYEHACLKLVQPLIAGIGDRRIRSTDPVSERVYERILDGLKKSSRVAQGISAFVRFAQM